MGTVPLKSKKTSEKHAGKRGIIIGGKVSCWIVDEGPL
jgi:hypothetical protein